VRTIEPQPEEKGAGGGETLSFFDSSHLRLETWERDRALGLGAWLHLSKSGRAFPLELARRLDRVLGTVPDDGAVLTVLGATALDGDRLDLAQEYYLQALTVADAEEAALSGLLKIHYLSANWQQALEYADRLLQIDPGNASAHSMRADSLKMLGRTDEAIDAALRALEFNPTLVPVRSWLADLYRAVGRNEEHRRHEVILRRMQQARSQ
jgi:tetratricopeptide (TPR) repeat protein